MALNGGRGFPAGEHLAVTEGTSFSQLLFAADEAVGFGGRFDYSQRSASFPADIKPPKMLCFGGYDKQSHGGGDGGVEIGFAAEAAKKSVVTCSGDSNSASSTSGASISALSKSNNKRRNGLCQESVQCASTATTTAAATAATQRVTKKTKSQNPPAAGNGKKKEKLGERIASLQQLVSPFGKTDTASVLHEAMGYIRFLHEQVQVLCSPYLQQQQQQHHQRLPSLPGGGEVGEDASKDLRSRGLCLVPVDYTMHVANTNGADFWSSAMANNSSVLSSSTKY